MAQIVNATFDGGAFQPDERLNLPPQARVRLIVEPLPVDSLAPQDALSALDRLCDAHPIQSDGIA